ncbi:MAG: hypothetical protein A2Z29_07615 [Chloroflexi bacterium RBG_16_56_11]|nr:MAG: hypothetical protein A2Z29_07615 [Chloroflexi bacterium RBG_16_56_11]
MFLKNKILLVSIIVLVVITGTVGGSALISAATGDDNVIYAAYTKGIGILRIIKNPGDARKFEAVISWNKEGPQGPQGEPGPAGLPGPQGEQGPPGSATPKIAFFVGKSTKQVITDSAYHIVEFDTGPYYTGPYYFNDGGGWDDETNKFTPPQPGVYQLNIVIAYYGNSFLVNLMSDDGYVYMSEVSGGFVGTHTVSITHKSDGSPLWVEVKSSNIEILPHYSSFSGHLVYQ